MTKRTLTLGVATLAVAASALDTPSFAIKPQGTSNGPSKEQRAAWMIKRLDTNKDGKVSLAEAEAGAAATFTAFDADRNGEVTPDEIKARQDAIRAARAEIRSAAKGPEKQEARAKLREMRPGLMPGVSPRMFKQADIDKDGALSLSEVTSMVGERFKRRDTNGDGFIDASDLTRKI